MPIVGSQVELEKLTSCHTFKMLSRLDFSKEEVSFVVGEVMAFNGVKLPPCLNSVEVIFLDSVDKVEKIVEPGIALGHTFTLVQPLVNPSQKVTI